MYFSHGRSFTLAVWSFAWKRVVYAHLVHISTNTIIPQSAVFVTIREKTILSSVSFLMNFNQKNMTRSYLCTVCV